MKKIVALFLVSILMMGLGGCSTRREKSADVKVPVSLQNSDGTRIGNLHWYVTIDDASDNVSITVSYAVSYGNGVITHEYVKYLSTGNASYRSTDGNVLIQYFIDSVEITETTLYSTGTIWRDEQSNEVTLHVLKDDVGCKYDEEGNCIYIENEDAEVVSYGIDRIDTVKTEKSRKILSENVQEVFFEFIHIGNQLSNA